MRAYAIWVVSAFFVMYQFSLQISVGVMADELKHDLSANAMQIGVLTAVFAVAYAAMQVPVGVLLDRLSPRWLMTGAIGVCAVGVMLFAGSESVAVAAAARLLMGLSAAFGFVGTGLLASRWMPANRFALFIGLTEMFGMLGAAGASSIVAALLKVIGWRQLMLVAGVFGLGLCVVFWLIVRDRPGHALAPNGPHEAMDRTGVKLQEAIGRLATNRQIWLAAIFYGLSLGVAFGFAGLWDIPFLQAFDRDLGEATHANAFIFLGLAAGNFISGWLSDKLGRRRAIVRMAMLGAVLVMAFVLYTPKMPVFVVWSTMFLLGFFMGANVLAFAMAADESDATARATAIGLVNTFGFIGVTLLQMTPGMLIAGDTTPQVGEYQLALTAFPLALLAALGIALAMKRTSSRPTP